MCSYFTHNQDDLVNHVIRRHHHDKNFIIYCCYASCGMSFHNLHSFRSHARRKHGHCSAAVGDLSLGATPVSHILQDDSDSLAVKSLHSEAAYILKLRARHRLSQSAVKDVCESTKELFRMKVSGLSHSLDVSEVSESLFTGLETQFRQDKYFNDHFGLVYPQVQKLGTYTVDGQNHRCTEKDAHGYYVPLKSQLETLLCMPEVQECIDNNQSVSTSDYVHDICDAFYVEHHAINTSSTTLKLCLYTGYR